MTRLGTLLVVLAIVASAAMVACSDSDDDGDKATVAAGEPTATESSGDTTPDDAASTGDGTDDIAELAGAWADNPATINYSFTSSTGTGDGSYVLYWNPPDQWRVDFNIEGSEANYIKNADGTFICTPNGDGTGICIDYPIGVPPVPFLGTFLVAGDYTDFVEGNFGGVGADKSQETIAGMSASCYSVSTDVAGASSQFQWCVSDDGLPLRVKASAGGQDFTYEATSAETNVDAADFTLPFEVQSLGG
jgi:hypothetical protein